jgi:RNA polymerase sigma-70 factor (ECF subfamily)
MKERRILEQFTEEYRGQGRLMSENVEQKSGMAAREVDGHVIEACRRGEQSAFQELFEAYQDRVYSIALHFCGDQSLAKDISQQVFLKVFTRIGQFRREAGFTTWLYRIVANVCIDEQRSRKRFIPLDPEMGAPDMRSRGSVEEAYLRRQVAESVRLAVGELKPKLRITMLLKYVEGLSYEEIAAALGCSAGTVASRLNRGHKILARKLAHLRGAVTSDE